MIKQAVKEASILILAAVAIAWAVYAVRPDKIGPAPETTDGTGSQPVAVAAAIPEIPIVDALRHFEAKTALFADARHPVDYKAGHIRGADNLYAFEPEPWLADWLIQVAPETLIITYCDGEDCHLATQLAELLTINGYTNVRYLKNGWTRWRERGYPIE